MNEPRENPEFRFCKQFFQFIMLDGKRCVIISVEVRKIILK
jgi:hypothetical protein